MVRALTAADRVRARIARARLGDDAREVRTGRFTLRAVQRETLAAVVRALDRHGGALLADPPGTGKTVIALALARHLQTRPLVVAPAALAAQWQRAAADADAEIVFVSLEALGRGTAAASAPLVIVDEAHHARTPTTRRYARLAQLCVGARVLLLSATPVVNRASDRDSLLALFLGERAASLDAQSLAEVVIRRRSTDDARPRVRRIAPLIAASDVPELGDAIMALPPPLPAADGSAATALVRITLAMAWRSSLAALDATLRRREQRGSVLRDALADGRWPDRAQLRHWILGDDATQLALSLVLDSGGSAPDGGALGTIGAHLDALRALRQLIAPHLEVDGVARAAALLALCSAHPDARVVCFAQHAATIRSLWRSLRRTPGVIAITGERVHAAAGRWTRDEVLRALGPRAGPLRADDPHAIRLLLATDLLAEGVELQGVSIVVHGDAAWTPARVEQRVGRAVRAESSAVEVIVTQFEAPRGAYALLRLAARLARKRNARTTALATASAEERVARLLSRWSAAEPSDDEVGTAVVEGIASGFLALVRRGPNSLESLIAGFEVGGRWRVSADPRVVARRIADAGGSECVSEARHGAPHGARERAALLQWLRGEAAVERLGGSTGADAVLWRRLRQRVDRALAHSTLVERSGNAFAWSGMLRALRAMPGVGARRKIESLDRDYADDRAFVGALSALAVHWGAEKPALGNTRTRLPRDRTPTEQPQILALLLIERSRRAPAPTITPEEALPLCAPPAASIDSAGTR